MNRLLSKALLTALVVALLALLGYLADISIRIGRQSTRDEAQPADAILVLGAAEYRGHPSPVLKARLDHALDLYARKMGPVIITTGGAGGDPDYTEGGVGRSYLIEHNVPSEAIIVEPEGDTTAYSIAAVGEIIERLGLKSCILVSDGYHIFRAKKMLEFRGVRVYGSPRASNMHEGPEQWWLYFRQSVGYLMWALGLSG
jgi:uncharacterized SAM-binding protein YcdF (DUF218 family)